MNFTFNSRDSYLQYRAEWKARYAKATLDNRAAKEGIREASREFAKIYSIYARRTSEYREALRKLASSEIKKQFPTREARELLEELVEAKKESCRQFNLTRT